MKDMLQKQLRKIKQDGLNPIMRTLCLAILILIAIGGYGIYKTIWPTYYVSQTDNFKILFHQKPTTNKLAAQKGAEGVETGEIYSIQNKSKTKVYTVYVTNYQSINFSKLSASSKYKALKNEMLVLANSEQSNITSGQELTFEGLTSLKATFTPANSAESKTQLIAFFNNSRLYIIFGTGLSQTEFNSFINTFHLLK